MKKHLFLAVSLLTFFCSAKVYSQTFMDGFAEGILNGEYIKSQAIAAHPEYGITYTWEWHMLSQNYPGGINPAVLADTASHVGATVVMAQIIDPGNMMVEIFQNVDVQAVRQYHWDNWINNPSEYNHGLVAGLDARLSGKH